MNHHWQAQLRTAVPAAAAAGALAQAAIMSTVLAGDHHHANTDAQASRPLEPSVPSMYFLDSFEGVSDLRSAIFMMTGPSAYRPLELTLVPLQQ